MALIVPNRTGWVRTRSYEDGDGGKRAIYIYKTTVVRAV